MIDAHMHLWKRRDVEAGWVANMPALCRDFSAADYLPFAKAVGVESALVVQALENEAETERMIGWTEAHDWLAGVIGWVDLAASDAAERVLWLAELPSVVGIRNWPMLRDYPDWVSHPSMDHGFAALAEADLAYDTLVRPENLPGLLQRLDRTPGLRICINHLSYPRPCWSVGGPEEQAWKAAMSALAEAGCTIKLSGFGHRQGGQWKPWLYDRFVDRVLELFGPSRMIWASNWPTSLPECSFADWVDVCMSWTSDLGASDRAEIFGGAARRFYRLDTGCAG